MGGAVSAPDRAELTTARRHARLRVPMQWSLKQWDAISFRVPFHVQLELQSTLSIICLLGDFGGGKSTGAAGRFLQGCLENPFISKRQAEKNRLPWHHTKGDPPMSAIVDPTISGAKEGSLKQFFRVCPPKLVRSVRLYGEYQDVTLHNGHRIKIYSTAGAIDGPSLCQMWADEIQHKKYGDLWENLQNRVRDERAINPTIIVSGRALRGGHVEELFGDKRRANRKVIVFATEDNKHLAQGVVSELKASLPSSMLERDAEGWAVDHDIMFNNWSPENMQHDPDDRELSDRPADLGVDLSRRAAAVFSVPWDTPKGGRGMMIVDQLMTEGTDAETIARRCKTEFPWKLIPGKSVIGMDPTASQDEINHFRRTFPGVQIVQHLRGPYHDAETGQRAVARAVKDGTGVVRLFVRARLKGKDTRGIPEVMTGYRYSKLKDGKFEHGADALRYIVQHRIPLPAMSYSINLAQSPALFVPGWRP